MKTLLLALLAVGTAYAADPVKLTLEDFTDGNGAKPGAGWTTEEGGVIHLTPTKGSGFLVSKKEYASFEMEWDWKLADAGNNGIKYWVSSIKDAKGKGEWLGIEYQMIDDDKHPTVSAAVRIIRVVSTTSLTPPRIRSSSPLANGTTAASS